MNRLWLPGWQFAADTFAPLSALIADPDIEDIFLDYADSELTCSDWLDQQAQLITEPCELVGWSLGGMLAVELATRTPQIQRLILLHCNVQFAGGPGLDARVAEQFRVRYQRNPVSTRQRFAALVDAQQPDLISRQLRDRDDRHSLGWLYELSLLQHRVSCPCHVLLTEHDHLVPSQSAAEAWRLLGANVTVVDGEHGLPITHVERVADWMHCLG